MQKLGLVAAAFVLTWTTSAQAFCGFYVKEDDTRITSRSSRVVLLRDGDTTVLSMQNSYEGPAEDFALIIPVPTAIGQDDVRTLDRDVFDRIDQLTSPRLVEYWEQEPTCPAPGSGFGTIGYGRGGGSSGRRVRVEASFAVGEYDIVILGADDSTSLETWLRSEGYRVPDGASEALRPYVEQGYRFFAARVNAERVQLEDGRAMLSPLRIRYESPQLALPVRLGLLSSPGEQDLIVFVISRDGRFEVANRDNVFVPTNLEVRSTVRGRFGAFYDALLDRVWERNPGSVITEYAWSATTCDPCPGPTMSAEDITTLGGDSATGATRQPHPSSMTYAPTRQIEGPRPGRRVSRILFGRQVAMQECVTSPETFVAELTIDDRELVSAEVRGDSQTVRCIERALRGAQPSEDRQTPLSRVRVTIHINHTVRFVQRSAQGFTVTRMRYRYGADSPATDLVFRRARSIRGGTGVPDQQGHLATQVTPIDSNISFFQARYAILHRQRTRTSCPHPRHGGWGGPPDGRTQTRTARALGPARRGVRIEHLIRTPVPSLGLRPARARPAGSRASKTFRIKA